MGNGASSGTSTSEITARDPRAEAQERLGGGLVARVLEPSPPVVGAPWFADDPVVAASGAPRFDDDPVVSPIAGAGDRTWDDVVAARPELAEFACQRWLGSRRRLGPAPAGFTETRESLRALAFFVLSPARQAATGKIAMRWTRGGFGTPFFAARSPGAALSPGGAPVPEQVRVEGTAGGAALVHQRGTEVRSAPVTTLADAAALLGVAVGPPAGIDFHDAPPLPDLARPLEIDPAAAAFVDDWFGFATVVLETLLTEAGRPGDTRVQLWTEHFDPAVELGDADAGQRASFGASPGDAAHPDPYLYVSPWRPQQGEFWSAPFGGALLPLAHLVAAGDQVAAALDFLREGRRRIRRAAARS